MYVYIYIYNIYGKIKNVPNHQPEHILFLHNAFHTDAPPGSCGSASSECICTTAASSIAALAKPTLSADIAGDKPSELLGTMVHQHAGPKLYRSKYEK